jgi:glyoxylase-like metal-dependent hydrolase (beta-lactamase superfamily II)
MKIEIKTPQVVYVTIDNHTYYIDNSTNEQIVEKYVNDAYVIRDRESGNLIVDCVTLEEAEKIVSEFEADDIKENNYIPNFYEIVKL